MYKALHSDQILCFAHGERHAAQHSTGRAPCMMSKSRFLQGTGARRLSKAFQISQQRPTRSASSHSTTVCRQVCGILGGTNSIWCLHQRRHRHVLDMSSPYTVQSSALTCRAGMQVQKVTAEELEVAIQTRDRPLVIDFYATWCGPCLLLAKELEQVRALPHVLGGNEVTVNWSWLSYMLALIWWVLSQVYDELGDDIRIVKIDTDENPDLSSQLQVCDAAYASACMPYSLASVCEEQGLARDILGMLGENGTRCMTCKSACHKDLPR